MCGRVGFFDDIAWKKAVNNYYGRFNDKIGMLVPHYNIAPSQSLVALLNNGNYTFTHFGLIPHWMKEKKTVAINARSETLSQKPSFRDPFKRKRCLIPVNGFYEWKKEGNTKVPYWFYPSDGDYFALAGLWDQWVDKESGEIITSSAIITTEPNKIMKPIHDRMPVILKPDAWKLWLDPDIQESGALIPLLEPSDSKLMSIYEVSTYVNSPAHDDRKAIEAAIAAPTESSGNLKV
ncbi:MAG: SOS response-associated peptidase [Campylobacterota bacterium]|nr:SOS response-associated peptidase [Campylobacterota bacterium]